MNEKVTAFWKELLTNEEAILKFFFLICWVVFEPIDDILMQYLMISLQESRKMQFY